MKINYIGEAVLEVIQGTGKYLLAKPMLYLVDGKKDYVPYGVVTDLATIPRIFWSFIASDDKGMLEASIIHDYIYSTKNSSFSRKDADDLLMSGMNYLNRFTWATKWLVYLSVRAFGWLWWVK